MGLTKESITAFVSNVYEQVENRIEYLSKTFGDKHQDEYMGVLFLNPFNKPKEELNVMLTVCAINGKDCVAVKSNRPHHRISGDAAKELVAFDFKLPQLSYVITAYVVKVLLKIPYTTGFKLKNEDIVYCNYPRRGRKWHVMMINGNELIEKFYNCNNYLNGEVK